MIFRRRKSIDEIAIKECSILLKKGDDENASDNFIFCTEILKARGRGEISYTKAFEALTNILPPKKAKKILDHFEKRRKRAE